MTTQQIAWMTCAYALVTITVAYLTRAVPRRIVGALVGGAVAGLVLIVMVAIGERAGWWHWQFQFSSTRLATLFFVGGAISCAPIYLVTWRVARRFGWRGLAAVFALAGVMGPPRDYLLVRFYPEWGGFSSGVAPVLADAIAYAVMVVVGYGAMRITSGPARGDRLVSLRRP